MNQIDPTAVRVHRLADGDEASLALHHKHQWQPEKALCESHSVIEENSKRSQYLNAKASICLQNFCWRNFRKKSSKKFWNFCLASELWVFLRKKCFPPHRNSFMAFNAFEGGDYQSKSLYLRVIFRLVNTFFQNDRVTIKLSLTTARHARQGERLFEKGSFVE